MSAVEAIDWQEIENKRHAEIYAAYNRLLGLVTAKYKEIEYDNPKLVRLAKAMAKTYHAEDIIDTLCYDTPGDISPISKVDNKCYPNVSWSVIRFVPLWALYLPRAREAIELMKEVEAA